MSHCGARQEEAHGPSGHSCIGDKGHQGKHWCLLGHTWPAAEKPDEETS